MSRRASATVFLTTIHALYVAEVIYMNSFHLFVLVHVR